MKSNFSLGRCILFHLDSKQFKECNYINMNAIYLLYLISEDKDNEVKEHYDLNCD